MLRPRIIAITLCFLSLEPPVRDELTQPLFRDADQATGRFRRLAALVGLAVALLTLWLASGLLVPPTMSGLSGQLQGLATIFLGIFIEALPFLLAGVLASAAIHVFVSPEHIQRLSPRSPLQAALLGSLLGLCFPVCECGAVPATRRLLSKGAPPALGIAFLLAAPVVNPVVIASTWVAFGMRPEVVVGRIGLTVVIAAVVGLVLGRRAGREALLAAPDHHSAHDHHDHQHESPTGRVHALFTHAVAEFFEMGRYLVLGALIAATLQTAVPREALLAVGQGPLLAPLVMMALAFVLSICSTVDAFVALAFVNSFPAGALLAFLVFGPMVDIKSLLMYTTTFQRGVVAWLVALTAMLTLVAAVAINLVWG
jgi:uncharacterized membrane protein YraQ (UPF0718 family)